MNSTQSKYGGARVRFPPPLVFLTLVVIGVLLQRAVRPVAIPLGLWTRIGIGAVILLAGLSSVVSARIWFTRTGQSPIPWKPSPELLVQGIYRHTRNPMYVGVTVIQMGLGVLLDNLWISMLAPLALALVHFIAVRPEEAYLAEKFGDSYLHYKASVRRYL
jgi:protein-S-isoprenylcysteine O-methyltransferase Ste14